MLDDSERQAYYSDHHIPDGYVGEIECMRLESPAREVGKSALKNMVTYLYSHSMKKHLICESRSCEALGFMQLEHEKQAIEIYPQAKMMRVERFSASGHRTLEPMYCDAMVLTPTGIVFLECKYRSELEKLAETNPREWIKTEAGWSRPAVEQWALKRGCRYEIYVPPEPHGKYWANMEVLFPMIGTELTNEDERVAQQIIQRCTQSPAKLAELVYEHQVHVMRVILLLLANRRIFGTLRGGLLNRPETMVISVDRDRIDELDSSMLTRMREELAPIEATDPLLCATRIDYQRAQARLARVTAMIEGKEPATRKFRPLIKRVRIATAEGRSTLAQCLTAFHRSGNRETRLPKPQREAIGFVIDEYWNKGLCTKLDDLFSRLKKRCERLGISDIPSKTTLGRTLKRQSTAKHNIATGGNRAFHANQPPSDPRQRSVRSIALLHLVHIDATKFDHRSASTTCPALPFSCPTLYTGIDQASDDIVGRSLSFGAPSRFGLALLLRDIVDRQQQLPWAIVFDRGSEAWTKMIVGLAAQYGITLYMRPAGAGRYGSEIENALREINQNIAHRLIGTTLTDQKGRAVDGRFKSYRTARLAFDVVVEVLDHFLFTIWPTRPIGELGRRPEESRAELSALGVSGRPVTYDFNFELATSVPIENRDWKQLQGHSVRVMYRRYNSAEMTLMLRESGKPDEVRLDCADPSRCYAKFGAMWVRAFSNDVLAQQVSSELDRIFSTLYTRDLARKNRQLKDDVRDNIIDRIDLANASAPATQNVQPRAYTDENQASTASDDADDKPPSLWEFDPADTPAFEEESDV